MFLPAFFVVISAALGAAPPAQRFATLDVARCVNDRVQTYSVDLDNVHYKHFTPVEGCFITHITESELKIWEAQAYQLASFCLTAYANDVPTLLYVKADNGYKTEHLYFRKKNGAWGPVDINDYSDAVTDLCRGVPLESNFVLDLDKGFPTTHYAVNYSTKDRPYTVFTPNAGHFATYVYESKTKLWSAKQYGDRCVAAWAYIHGGVYYMIRLLVTNHKNESDLLTFFRVKNAWVHIHTLHDTHDKDVYVQRPDNFPYPNYTFNLKPSQLKSESRDIGVATASKMADDEFPEEGEVFSESYFDLTGDYAKYRVHDSDFWDEEETRETRFLSDEDGNFTEAYFDLTDDYRQYKVHDTDVDHDYDEPPAKQKPLDLDTPMSLFFSDVRQLDNVVYKTYAPLSGSVVTQVNYGSHALWKAKSQDEKCLYAMAPQDKSDHAALFLLLEVNGERRRAFFRKDGDAWKRSNYKEYVEKVRALATAANETLVAMDVANARHDGRFAVEPATARKPQMVSPRPGYTCNRVAHGEETVWEAQAPGERCVAAWTKVKGGEPYHVQLLVTNARGVSDLASYLNVGSGWVRVGSYRECADKARFRVPAGFFNPEYEFNAYVPHYDFDGSAGKGKRTDADKAAAAAKLAAENYGTQPTRFDKEDCELLDLAKLGRRGGLDVEWSVFDGKLDVLSCRPAPGRFFDAVYDGRHKLFRGNALSHVCHALNFYTVRGEPYLGELLVKVRDEDLTLHVSKAGGAWSYVPPARYRELLEELRSRKL